MKLRAYALLLCSALAMPAADKPPKPGKDGWVKMFDGKTLKNWKANENAESWTVVDGAIQGKGNRSHLFFEPMDCDNCEFKVEVKLTPGSNSGMFFRSDMGTPWPKGYEAQVNNTHGDWRKTGSLYAIQDVKEQLAQDNVWWTQHIIADGNHIVIKVNDKVAVDYVDEQKRFMKGYLGLQQHDPKSVVQYRNIMMRKLPAKK